MRPVTTKNGDKLICICPMGMHYQQIDSNCMSILQSIVFLVLEKSRKHFSLKHK